MVYDAPLWDSEQFKEANRDYISRIERDDMDAIYDAVLDTLFVEIDGPKEALTEHFIDNIMVRIDPETLQIVGFEMSRDENWALFSMNQFCENYTRS